MTTNTTVRQLARDTGYTPGHISRIARGEKEPSLKCLNRVAESLGVSMDEAYAQLKALGEALRQLKDIQDQVREDDGDSGPSAPDDTGSGSG